MSQDRALVDEQSVAGYATCAARPDDVYVPRGRKDDPGWLWLGTNRRAELPDEVGAVAVVECVFGGRVRIYPVPGQKERRRVEQDVEWSRAASVSSGHAT